MADVAPRKVPVQRDQDYDVLFTWRTGVNKKLSPSPLRLNPDSLFAVTGLWDDGTIMDVYGQLFTKDGMPISLPHDGKRYLPLETDCVGKPCILLANDRPDRMPPKGQAYYEPGPTATYYLYDLRQQRLASQLDIAVKPMMLFCEGKRVAAVSVWGPVEIVEGSQKLKAFHHPNPARSWGDDGSIWTLDGSTIEIVHWRQGKPFTENAQLPSEPTNSFSPGDYSSSIVAKAVGESWAAVWGDGTLIARSDMVNLMPERVANTTNGLLTRCKIRKQIPSQTRRLTLYRQGRKVGSFSIYLKPSFQMPVYTAKNTIRLVTVQNDVREHIAFTKDGKYLSWVIDKGDGLQVYAFRVPGS
ncbi:MAG: hypothetical protein ACYDBB_13415 [Armatimonadota bacterium]